MCICIYIILIGSIPSFSHELPSHKINITAVACKVLKTWNRNRWSVFLFAEKHMAKHVHDICM